MTTFATPLRRAALGLAILALAGCGSSGSLGSIGSGPGTSDVSATRQATRTRGSESVAVNRYLWSAALETLSFLPVQSVDPFTGVIVFGYGTPPGGGRSYRATVYISDPALDARSLSVALATTAGPVAAETQRAVEDAILSRARQLRIRDGGI